MRPARPLYFLYTTPIALAAPVLPQPQLVKSLNQAESHLSSQPIGLQTPTSITIEGSRTVLLKADHSRIAPDEETAHVAFNNRPLPLSPPQPPASPVLDSSGPLTTEYLQALARLPSGQVSKPEPPVPRDMPVGSLVAPGSNPVDGVWHVQHVVVEMKNDSQAARPQAGVLPCAAAQHMDLLMIGMALVFVLIILAVAMWKPVSRFVCRASGREGAIRLLGDEKKDDRRVLSCRDPDLEIHGITDENRGEQGGGYDANDEEEDSGAEPWVL
ncbi:hypothetical protein VM1G_08733 [Cytospora mali]|uniref:Uncharacterized protein n=1 Tax=Cytospora mali TaxID=578113 RepID=A0A194WA46_CYTMA|nr:hypothetical protein VM1G_08733 [Valsa mali]